MKLKVLMLLLIGIGWGTAYPQSRKFVSQFSHFQSYYNPGLTGYEGSAIRWFVRNQWDGIDGAPKTFFISAEFDFAEMAGVHQADLVGKNAMSLNLLHDRYGAFLETEMIVSYASRIRLSMAHNLRLGAGLNYNTIMLDGNNIFGEQASDPLIQQYMGSVVNMEVLDFNIGMAFTHAKYYLSYGAHYVNAGRMAKGYEFVDRRPRVHILQAGVRERVSEGVSLIGNFFYRTQEDMPDNIEGNIKALLMESLWVGAGYRHTYAQNYQIGFVTPAFRLGYVYELPLNRQFYFLGQTHEFMLVLNIFQRERKGKALGMW